VDVPPALCALDAAVLPAAAESAVISPLNRETFDALAEALLRAVFPVFVAAVAASEPVRTTEPEAGYA
jgi:hypothetical protein